MLVFEVDLLSLLGGNLRYYSIRAKKVESKRFAVIGEKFVKEAPI